MVHSGWSEGHDTSCLVIFVQYQIVTLLSHKKWFGQRKPRKIIFGGGNDCDKINLPKKLLLTKEKRLRPLFQKCSPLCLCFKLSLPCDFWLRCFVFLGCLSPLIALCSSDRPWKASLCHVSCISGLTLFSATSSEGQKQRVPSTYFTTWLMRARSAWTVLLIPCSER